MQANVPNLLIIGSTKCGTSTLHRMLGKHDDIYMSDVKELNFFFPRFDGNLKSRAYRRYVKQFQTRGEMYRGESSPLYTEGDNSMRSAALIARHNPDAKLIYMLRQPVDRIVSHYRMESMLGLTDLEILDWVRRNEYVVKTSCYGHHLATFLEYFPKEQLHVIVLEEFRQEELRSLNVICDWLQIRRFPVDTEVTSVNVSTDGYLPRWVRIAGKYRFVHTLAREYVPDSMVKSLDRMLRMQASVEIEPEVRSTLIQMVDSRIQESMAILKKQLARDFAIWGF